MAKRSLAACRHIGCPNTHRNKHGYCDGHASEQWPNRGNSHQRGYGRKWRKLRNIILNRDSHLCQPCDREGRTTSATEVDHIIPKAEGGTDLYTNLQSICSECHAIKTSEEARRSRT